jgi:AcrR family transcriptional regulator
MSTQSPKTRLRAPERRELIVEAALDEFALRGYEAASMGRIAEAAGISRTVLYDHFPSKQSLFVSLLRDQHRALLAHMEAGLVREAPMEERMRATFDGYFAFAEEQPRSWRLLFPDHPPVDAEAAEEQGRCRTESNRLLAAMLVADAHRAGIDPASDVGRMVFTIHQAALFGLVRWWETHPEVPREDLVEATMQALWVGLGVADRT